MRVGLLLLLLLGLLAACGESSTSDVSALSKVARIESGKAILVFVYVDG